MVESVAATWLSCGISTTGALCHAAGDQQMEGFDANLAPPLSGDSGAGLSLSGPGLGAWNGV